MDNRLSAADMSSLFAERDRIHVNVGGTLIVEGAAPSYEQLFAQAAAYAWLADALRAAMREQPVPRRRRAASRG